MFKVRKLVDDDVLEHPFSREYEAHGGGCGRPGASRGVLSFSLRSPLTEPPSVIDVAYWHFSDLTLLLRIVCLPR